MIAPTIPTIKPSRARASRLGLLEANLSARDGVMFGAVKSVGDEIGRREGFPSSGTNLRLYLALSGGKSVVFTASEQLGPFGIMCRFPTGSMTSVVFSGVLAYSLTRITCHGRGALGHLSVVKW